MRARLQSVGVESRRVLFTAILAGVAVMPATRGAENFEHPASFRPAPIAAGTLRISGQPQMKEIVALWAAGFRRFHPEITIESHLAGSATAVPGLYAGRADIALLGRENNVTDDNGFSRPKGYAFRRFELMNGSLDAPGKSAALAVFVHRDNPIAKLTLAQLAFVTACNHRDGGAKEPTWGDLGAIGKWAGKPVHVYLFDTESGTGLFFVHVVLHGSRKLNWDHVQDFKDQWRADGSVNRASAQILAALRSDPCGLAISSLREATADVRLVSIAAQPGGPFVMPTRGTVQDFTYPLSRRTYAIVDHPPGKPLDPKVREFLSYALSREGQADVAHEGDYLPLSASDADRQLQRLKSRATGPGAGTTAQARMKFPVTFLFE